MGGKFDKEFIDKKGKRMDGRAPNELRPLKIEAGVLDEADGSCYLEWGNNKVYCGVFGPIECHPRHRKRPGLDRRSTEIGLLISEALERVVMVEKYPKAAIRVDIQVVEAHAGTRCAALTAASVAVADAGIPMKDLVPSCATGKVDGKVVLDLNKEEDNFGEADLPLAVLPATEEVVLMQMDGELTPDEFEEAFNMAIEGCKQVYEVQRNALKNRYGGK